MKGNELIQLIEKRFPTSYALSWDNVGLMVGDGEKEVHRVLVALDATEEVVEQAISQKADWIVTHHPLFFQTIKKITTADSLGRKVIKLIQNGIGCYSMHTNYDVLGMADLNAELLGLQEPFVLEVTGDWQGEEAGIGRVGRLPKEMTLRECCEHVKQAFGLTHVTAFGDLEQTVKLAAVSSGAGKSQVEVALEKGAQVLITGDMDYHHGIDAVSAGIAVIDAGHYGTEYICMKNIADFLTNSCEGLQVFCAQTENPLQVI